MTTVTETTEIAKTAKRPRPKTRAAWAIARGETSADASAPGAEIIGARSDYNSRGRGSTMARRVYRDGAWSWVSEPARDRRDTRYGNVWPGDIVAEYVLGGHRTPTDWYLIIEGDKPRQKLDARLRRDGQYSLTVHSYDDAEDVPGELVVPHPYWR